MRKKMEWQWEKLDESTWRAKIIGGWIVLHIKTFAISGSKNYSQSQSESMVFVSDRDHEWTIVEPLKEIEVTKPTVKAADFEPNK